MPPISTIDYAPIADERELDGREEEHSEASAKKCKVEARSVLPCTFWSEARTSTLQPRLEQRWKSHERITDAMHPISTIDYASIPQMSASW